MRKAAVAAFVVALAAFVAFAALPFLTRTRDFPASITSPTPPTVVLLDDVRAGRRLCMNRIAIEPRSGVARFRAGTYMKPGPALTVAITGPSYRFTKRIAAGYPDNQLQQIAVPHPRAAQLVTVCIRNDGKTKIALYSGGGRSQSRSQVSLGGKTLAATPAFGFWEAKRQSIAARAAVTGERITAFRGFLGHDWLVWTILVLALAALVAGPPVALWLSGD
jgi:hypothetical protein